MKTDYSEIVNVSQIGACENSIGMGDLLKKASAEHLKPSRSDTNTVLLIGIDYQNSFMENGELGVPGAHGDIQRVTQFIYDNMEKISRIATSIDTHNPFQIFHPAWWIDEAGNNPIPFEGGLPKIITAQDVKDGKWTAGINPLGSIDYLENLEKSGKVLVIWPYHCLQGTHGCALENQFANMVYFHSVARKWALQTVVKGRDPLTEMYGIIKPEYDPNNLINTGLLNKIAEADQILIAGEAKSHCVLESVSQILDHFDTRPDITQKFFILEDTMSVIPSFEDATQKAFDDFNKKAHVNITNTVDLKL